MDMDLDGDGAGDTRTFGRRGGRGPLPTPGELIVSLTGRGSVAIAGDPVTFATRHAELALYLLVLAGPEGLPREQLLTALWPGIEARRAMPRLRTALWQMRSSLSSHADRIRRERGVIRFDLDGVVLDVALDAPIRRDGILVGWNVDLVEILGDRVA